MRNTNYLIDPQREIHLSVSSSTICRRMKKPDGWRYKGSSIFLRPAVKREEPSTTALFLVHQGVMKRMIWVVQNGLHQHVSLISLKSSASGCLVCILATTSWRPSHGTSAVAVGGMYTSIVLILKKMSSSWVFTYISSSSSLLLSRELIFCMMTDSRKDLQYISTSKPSTSAPPAQQPWKQLLIQLEQGGILQTFQWQKLLSWRISSPHRSIYQ